MGSTRPLYKLHPRALTVVLADAATFAAAQREVLIGTLGSLLVRENAKGFRFYARQFYDVEGKKRETYVARASDMFVGGDDGGRNWPR